MSKHVPKKNQVITGDGFQMCCADNLVQCLKAEDSLLFYTFPGLESWSM